MDKRFNFLRLFGAGLALSRHNISTQSTTFALLTFENEDHFKWFHLKLADRKMQLASSHERSADSLRYKFVYSNTPIAMFI